MASLAQFRPLFPEFNGASDSLVGGWLLAAALELDAGVWGPPGDGVSTLTKYDSGQMYLAAHKMATSPWGQNAKMVSNKNDGYAATEYGKNFRRLMGQVTSGKRVC